MSRAKLILGVLGGGVVLVGAVAGGAWIWAGMKVDATFAKTWETHEIDFPIPFPLTEDELAELREQKAAEIDAAGEGGDGVADVAPADPDGGEGEADVLADVDLDALALERAVARGKHYAESIYVCTGCHGTDLGGGTMLDEAPIGVAKAPNLTTYTKDYKSSDWDRAVRHGALPSGKTSLMPVGDFKRMSNRELSDLAAYIRSLPVQEGGETHIEWGPMGRFLIAGGVLVPDAYKIEHGASHADEPPPIGPTVEYGEHITTVCSGCHREEFNGGPMPFGPPDWPPAGNLTPHEDGLAGWTYEDFENAIVRGKRKNGEQMRVPMVEILPYAGNMTEDEKKAMWAYLSQLPPTPTGE